MDWVRQDAIGTILNQQKIDEAYPRRMVVDTPAAFGRRRLSRICINLLLRTHGVSYSDVLLACAISPT